MNNEHVSGLQVVALNERARLLRFLAARGAGNDAEDLFQELWQRVARTPAQPVSDPMSYLFRTAENLIRDVRRSQISRERRQLEWHDTGETAEDHPLGERVLIARERLEMVSRTLEQLGPRVVAVFRLYRLDGMTQAAIAREYGISLSSVEKDLQKAYRALAQLKAKFDAE
ncbi:RNA polymerase sigma factor [Aurantiacibacter hainanensis]|uniref:RNA polymerase sigma factor n=1 Tax=Aurantiacibacter hainanensis TaxID=3076114 RepID=UPI0030C6D88C